MDFRFQHIELFIALAVIPLLIFLFWMVTRWKKNATKKIGDEHLVKLLIRNFSSRAYFIKFLIALLAFLFIITGAANLQKPGVMDEVQRKGVDVMIALDVSKSMLAQDIQPNRLERAKQFLNRLISQLPDDRIGLILFAGRAYMQMPLTSDHNSAIMFIQNASPETVPTQGTVISEALRMSNTAFQRRDRKFKAVILVTDGEDHDPGSLKLAEELAGNGIMINAVGIGSPDGAVIPDAATNDVKKDEQGNTVISKLNEAELQQIAQVSKGVYVHLEDPADAVNAITRQLGTIEETALDDQSFKDYISYFQWFLGIALLLLLIEFLLSEKKWKLSMKRNPGLIVLMFLLTASSSSAQEENTYIRKGNALYKKGEVDKSLPEYKKATEINPLNPLANYNLGNAFFRHDNWNESVQAYENAIANADNNSFKEKSYYNKGVSLSKLKKLEESIEAYKNALKLDPNDEDARHNLQKALYELKQQNKQQEQQNKEQQKEEEKPQQKDKPKERQSKLNKRQVENLLKALAQKEQDVQRRMQQKSRGAGRPEKDW